LRSWCQSRIHDRRLRRPWRASLTPAVASEPDAGRGATMAAAGPRVDGGDHAAMRTAGDARRVGGRRDRRPS